jgi:hypothetical protein
VIDCIVVCPCTVTLHEYVVQTGQSITTPPEELVPPDAVPPDELPLDELAPDDEPVGDSYPPPPVGSFPVLPGSCPPPGGS